MLSSHLPPEDKDDFQQVITNFRKFWNEPIGNFVNKAIEGDRRAFSNLLTRLHYQTKRVQQEISALKSYLKEFDFQQIPIASVIDYLCFPNDYSWVKHSISDKSTPLTLLEDWNQIIILDGTGEPIFAPEGKFSGNETPDEEIIYKLKEINTARALWLIIPEEEKIFINHEFRFVSNNNSIELQIKLKQAVNAGSPEALFRLMWIYQLNNDPKSRNCFDTLLDINFINYEHYIRLFYSNKNNIVTNNLFYYFYLETRERHPAALSRVIVQDFVDIPTWFSTLKFSDLKNDQNKISLQAVLFAFIILSGDPNAKVAFRRQKKGNIRPPFDPDALETHELFNKVISEYRNYLPEILRCIDDSHSHIFENMITTIGESEIPKILQINTKDFLRLRYDLRNVFAKIPEVIENEIFSYFSNQKMMIRKEDTKNSIKSGPTFAKRFSLFYQAKEEKYWDQRHQNSAVARQYDKKFGLVAYKR